MTRQLSSLHPDDGIPVTDYETILVILHYILMTAYLLQMTRQFSSSFYYILMKAYLSQMTRDSSRHPSLHPDDGIPVADDQTVPLAGFGQGEERVLDLDHRSQ
jgi:hypothetical protein